jgi:hypothetical protein
MIRSLHQLTLLAVIILAIGPTNAQSTFSQINSLLQLKCTQGCHSAQSNAGNLNLTGTDAEVYSRIVNVNPTNPAALAKNNKLIRPGYPERSFLYRKINNNLYEHAGLAGIQEGNPMPTAPVPALTNAEVEMIRQWIYRGAPMTGAVVNMNVINEYYTVGGINAIPVEPPLPSTPGSFRIHLGKLFLAPQNEEEYFIKYALELPDTVKVNRLDLHMAPQSHHFIVYKLLPNSVNNFAEGLRLQNPQNGTGSSTGNNTIVNAWQISYNTQLPENTAYVWADNDVLDLNYHIRNYSTDSILAVEAFLDVYTEPKTSPSVEMISDLVTNLQIFIPNNGQPVTFSRPVMFPSASNYFKLWQLTSHTHKYGIDYDIFVRNADGAKGEQIYEGFYNVDYMFNQGFYDFTHPPIRTFDDFYQINPRTGLIHEATFRNTGPSPVTFGLTTEDEMMVFYYQYILGELIDGNPTAIITPEMHQLNIFPNPSNGNAQLELSLASNESVNLIILDLQGKSLYNLQLGNQPAGKLITSLNRDGIQLAKGIYFARVSIGNQFITKKFIIN